MFEFAETGVRWVKAPGHASLARDLLRALGSMIVGLGILWLASFGARASYRLIDEACRHVAMYRVIRTETWEGIGAGIGVGMDTAILLVIGTDLFVVAWYLMRRFTGKRTLEREPAETGTVDDTSSMSSLVPKAPSNALDGGLGSPWVRRPPVRRAIVITIAPVLALSGLAIVLLFPLMGATMLGSGIDGLLSSYVFVIEGPRTIEGLGLCAGELILGFLGGSFLYMVVRELLPGLFAMQRQLWKGRPELRENGCDS